MQQPNTVLNIFLFKIFVAFVYLVWVALKKIQKNSRLICFFTCANSAMAIFMTMLRLFIEIYRFCITFMPIPQIRHEDQQPGQQTTTFSLHTFVTDILYNKTCLIRYSSCLKYTGYTSKMYMRQTSQLLSSVVFQCLISYLISQKVDIYVQKLNLNS